MKFVDDDDDDDGLNPGPWIKGLDWQYQKDVAEAFYTVTVWNVLQMLIRDHSKES